MNENIVICLPARYQSSRLPGKPMLKILDKPLVIWALESAKKLHAKHMLVATDDKRIYDLVLSEGYNALMTLDSHKTGTDRLAEVVNLMKWSDDTIVVNYQADEPLTPQENIEQLVNALIENPKADIATLYQPICTFQELNNPNNVKIVTDNKDYALYFSRAIIPFPRDSYSHNKLDETVEYKHHIGLYAYRVDFLRNFPNLIASDLEKTESLEQLRALANGYNIIVKKAIKAMPHGIDTPEDVERFQKLLLNMRN